MHTLRGWLKAQEKKRGWFVKGGFEKKPQTCFQKKKKSEEEKCPQRDPETTWFFLEERMFEQNWQQPKKYIWEVEKHFLFLFRLVLFCKFFFFVSELFSWYLLFFMSYFWNSFFLLRFLICFFLGLHQLFTFLFVNMFFFSKISPCSFIFFEKKFWCLSWFFFQKSSFFVSNIYLFCNVTSDLTFISSLLCLTFSLFNPFGV